MNSMTAMPSIAEGARSCRVITFGEIMFGLMRLHPRTGHSGDLDVFLKRLVEDTRLLFSATGAAVALLDGQVCRWREKCGETGPRIGGPLCANSGISGECLASGRVQLCQDTLTDARFDAELCRQLRIRSMIVAPIRCPERVEGILEAWSSRALAFDRDCTETLQKLADFSGRVTGLGRGFQERSAPTFIAVAAQRMTSFGREALQRAKECSRLMQVKISSAPAESVPLLMRIRAQGILSGVLLSTMLGAAWYGRAASVRSLPSTWKTPAHLSSRATLVDAPIAGPVEALPQPQPVPQLAHKRSRPGAMTLLPHAAAKKTEPLLVKPDVPHQNPVIADDATVPPSPELGTFGSWEKDTIPLLHLLSSMSVKPRDDRKISRGLTGGQLRLSVRPVYPSIAKAAEIEDTVVLQAVIDEQGRVQEISVQKGHPLLAPAALAAVKQWRYQPLLLDDSRVRMTTQISVKFQVK